MGAGRQLLYIVHIYTNIVRLSPRAPNLIFGFITIMSFPLKRFRINVKNIFLTYPRCSLTNDNALEQLLPICLPSIKKFIQVAWELHEDGSPHLHVLIQLESRAHITNKRLFDLRSPVSSLVFHRNL